MDRHQEHLARIKELLKKNPQGMSVTEISREIGKSMHSVGRYLGVLRASGQVEMRNYGMAKVFSLAQRVPLASLISCASEMIMILDRDLRIVQVNDPFLALFKVAKEECVGKNLDYLHVPDDPVQELIQELATEAKRALASSDYRYEFHLRDPDEERFFHGKFIPIVFDTGEQGLTAVLIDVTAHMIADRALRLSEERYRAVVEGQSEFICRFLPDGTHVFVNEAYCRSFGKTREEIIGKKFRPAMPEEDRKRLAEHVASLSSEHPFGSIEHRIYAPDGSIRWQLWNDQAIIDDTGRIVEYQSVGRDITTQKQMEEALRRSEEKYRELVERANSVILKMDRQGNITFFNEYAEQFFGYRQEEVLGRNVVGTIVPATESSGRDLAVLLERLCTDPTPYQDNENENITRDGRHVWMRWTNRAIEDADGRAIGVLSVGIDITEHRRIEEQLKSSERRFRELAEMLPQPVFEADTSLRITYGNEQAASLFGYKAEDVPPDFTLTQFVAPEDRERAGANLARIISEGVRTCEEYSALRHDGTTFPIVERSSPIFQNGKIVGIRGVVTDLTERKQVEEALRRERDFSAAVLDTIDALVVVLDRDGCIVRFNRGCERLTGYTQAEVRGRPFWDIFLAQDDVPTVRALFQSLTDGIAPQYGSNAWITKEGERRWIAWSNTVLRGADERVEYVIATGIDITGQKQLEEALRHQGPSAARIP